MLEGGPGDRDGDSPEDLERNTEIEHSTVDPEHAELVRRYEGMQAKRQRLGVFVKSWDQLYRIFTSQSPKEAVEALRAEGVETNPGALRKIRNQYFPMLRGYVSTQRPSQLQAKRAEIEKRLENSPAYRQLRSVCKKYGLELSTKTPSLDLQGRFLTDFIIDDVRCKVHYSTTVEKPSEAVQWRAHFRNPTATPRPFEDDFHIFLVDIDSKGVKEKTEYFVPVDVIVSAAFSSSVYIPVGFRSMQTNLGADMRVDWEKFRGDKGVVLLKAAAEKKKTSS